jgi:hypothetical protein
MSIGIDNGIKARGIPLASMLAKVSLEDVAFSID